jgi:hypothetical protein
MTDKTKPRTTVAQDVAALREVVDGEHASQETPAEVLAEMLNSPSPDWNRNKQLDNWADRLSRSLAAGRVASCDDEWRTVHVLMSAGRIRGLRRTEWSELQDALVSIRAAAPPAEPAKASGSAPDVSDEAIERALDAKIGLDQTLRQLIRGDTIDVVRALLAELGSASTPPASAPEVTDHDIHHATSAVVNDPHHNGGAAWQWQRGVLHHRSVASTEWVRVSSMKPTPKRILAIASALAAALQEPRHG